MGAVFLATEVALGRIVAVKVLSPSLARNERFRLRFEHEARAAAAISHPSVVQVYTVGETAGDPPLPYIIMQYVDGIALDEMLRRQGPFSERRARRLLRDVAAALAAAHERDLVHRDIKPANILIEGATGRVYVADFGISVALSPRAIGGAQPVIEHGLIIGTAPYMSPEQAAGDVVGPKSDVYSLGILAYEILSGSMPFDAHSASEWRAAHLLKQPTPLRERRKGISNDLARLVDRCLAKEPGLRPAAADLAIELLPSAEDEILWPPPGLAPLPVLGRWLRRAATILIGATAVFLGALAIPLPGVHSAAGWWEPWAGGTVVATSTAPAPNGGSVVIWQVTVLLSMLALSIALGLFVSLILRSQRTILELRGRGWRRETIRDALADPDGRTGLVLAGSAEFATKQVDARTRICRFRRLAHTGLLAGAGWIFLVLSTWAASVLAGSPLQPAGGPPIGPAQLLVVGLPIMAALMVTGAALFQERRGTGVPWRRAHTGAFAVPSDFTAAEITSWYAELHGDPVPTLPSRPPSRTLLRSIKFGAGLLTGWIIVGLLLLVTSTLFAGRLARRLGPDTATLAAFVEGIDSQSALANARAALRTYMPTTGLNDVTSDALLAGLLDAPPRGLPNYPVEPRIVLGSRQSGLASTTLVQEALARASELSADTLEILSTLADHPRTRAVRALARRRALTLPLEGDASSSIRTAMEANAAGAVLAAARGDLTDAAARLGENAAIAELALAAPGPQWPETGLRMLHSLVLLPLAEVERLRGNVSREAELRSAATGVAETIYRFGPSLRVGAIGLGGDPRDFRLLRRLQAKTSVPSGLRAAAIEESGNAVCLNPREWLAGAHPARYTELGGNQVVPNAFRTWGIASVVARIQYCADLSRT
jgi:Protein kinase domain